jgi:hypothetical protein
VTRLRHVLPHLIFVQVGAGTSEKITECDIDLIGETTLSEVAGLLSKAAFHIDNEGGLVHLARCYGVRCGVVFGPTPADYFAYPGNVNISPPICGNCWWMTRTWMDACAKGYSAPRCMVEQDPALVADRILAGLYDPDSTAAEATAATGEASARTASGLVPLPKR